MSDKVLLGLMKFDHAKNALLAWSASMQVDNCEAEIVAKAGQAALLLRIGKGIPDLPGHRTPHATPDWFLKAVRFFARHGPVLPMRSVQLMTTEAAETFLVVHSNAIHSGLFRCATRRQINVEIPARTSNRTPAWNSANGNTDAVLSRLLMSAEISPLKQVKSNVGDAFQVHLLLPEATAALTQRSLAAVAAMTTDPADVAISEPLPPINFEGLHVCWLSSRQITAAEILMDVSIDAPPNEIRLSVRQQLTLGLGRTARFEFDDKMHRQRASAATLLLRAADAHEALARTGHLWQARDIPYILPTKTLDFGRPYSKPSMHSLVRVA